MKYPLRKLLGITALAVLLGCSSGPTKWAQFHGDSFSQGFQSIESGFALSSAWVSESYRITSSSPVLGYDYEGKEILYVGTTDAHLIAINTSDGSEKWDRNLGDGAGASIVSSPAVSDKGDIYIITTSKISADLFRSTLHKVDEFSNPLWAYTFPNSGFTSGSPKVLTSKEQSLVFVYVTVGGIENPQGELFVLRDDDRQVTFLDRKQLGGCRYDITGSGPGSGDLFGFFRDAWGFITDFPVEFDIGGIPLADTFVAPTPALNVNRPKPLIAIADNLCSMGAYEWDGTELSVIWREPHDFTKHSSTALLPNGLMVFGRKDGKVFAYDAQTGVKMWEYDAGESALATPAAPPGQFVFVVSKSNIQVVHAADGSLIQDGTEPRKLALLSQTHSSPAVTANRVYVSSGEMLTVTYDLKTRGHDSNFQGNGLSSIAVSGGGDVYAVGIDGTIRKYKGTD
jgi:outer membrane protein assembly factor BamB